MGWHHIVMTTAAILLLVAGFTAGRATNRQQDYADSEPPQKAFELGQYVGQRIFLSQALSLKASMSQGVIPNEESYILDYFIDYMIRDILINFEGLKRLSFNDDDTSPFLGMSASGFLEFNKQSVSDLIAFRKKQPFNYDEMVDGEMARLWGELKADVFKLMKQVVTNVDAGGSQELSD